MVMAAGTGDGHPHHAACDDINPIVNDVVDIIDEAAAKRQIPEGGEGTFVAVMREQICGDLLLEELVVRQVFVESADDVIPIRVRVRVMAVLFADVAASVGVAGNIKPVPTPTLAVLRGGEE